MNRNKNEKGTLNSRSLTISSAPDPDYLSLSAITRDKGLSKIYLPWLLRQESETFKRVLVSFIVLSKNNASWILITLLKNKIRNGH